MHEKFDEQTETGDTSIFFAANCGLPGLAAAGKFDLEEKILFDVLDNFQFRRTFTGQ